MLLVVDIGNTLIKIGGFVEDKLDFTSKIETNVRKTEDQYAIDLRNILLLYGYEKQDVKEATISSVVPQVGENFIKVIKNFYNVNPKVVNSEMELGINIKTENPKILGTDLITGAVATKEKYKLPAIIFGFGTATTITTIDKNANLLGCGICAGIGTSLEAMATKTAKLPHITIEHPKNIIGTNTIEAMRVGIVYGAVCLLDGMVEKIEKEIGKIETVIITGGFAENIYGHTNRKTIYDENLILDGLKILNEKN